MAKTEADALAAVYAQTQTGRGPNAIVVGRAWAEAHGVPFVPDTPGGGWMTVVDHGKDEAP